MCVCALIVRSINIYDALHTTTYFIAAAVGGARTVEIRPVNNLMNYDPSSFHPVPPVALMHALRGVCVPVWIDAFLLSCEHRAR